MGLATPDRRRVCLALAALLAGCATSRPPAGGNRWGGRLALRVDSTPPQAFTARFDLEGSPRAGELRLSSVLGQTLATVRWSPAGAELQRGGDTTRRGSLDELTRELSGAELPVASLFDWLDGRASPTGGWLADLSKHAQGRFSARREQPLPVAELRVVVEP